MTSGESVEPNASARKAAVGERTRQSSFYDARIETLRNGLRIH
jgi:hypothetical protein